MRNKPPPPAPPPPNQPCVSRETLEAKPKTRNLTPAPPMRILLTAGPTREPLDPVRYLGNRSSGRMGAAIANAILASGDELLLVTGPTEIAFPATPTHTRIETAAQMHAAVMDFFPTCDLLIMAAAVADYRPKTVSPVKMSRSAGALTLELEPTEDIAAAACKARKPHQRVVGFSLEREGDVGRSLHKMKTKGLDMIVFNPLATMGAEGVAARLLYPNGRDEVVPPLNKSEFAQLLLARAKALF